eukprot:Blabericola_migrator_1__9541@NODE_5197_length_848_cov_62_912932_g2014_i1_p1_GENE_NODE_5197_length_848_cov_62_912932_g2014_i1NODE_5197_length_848_cov_62_912932_g2014_i1_p1_ORF_typecomplete_len146_score10_12_NODE_5197_length_848_cov_62_912932_g2014_i1143580
MSYTTQLDEWGRPAFYAMRAFLSAYQSANDQLLTCVAASESMQLSLVDESTNLVSHADFLGWSQESRDDKRSIKSLHIRDWESTRDDVNGIRQVTDEMQQKMYKDVRVWSSIYGDGDSITHDIGQAFAAVADLLSVQQELLSAEE